MTPTATRVSTLDALLEKIDAMFEFQASHLVERRESLWIVLLGLFTPGFHVLLYGPPGVAKSLLFEGLEHFAPTMNWFSTPAFKGSPPEQFLGPVSLRAMTAEDERYERIVKGKFPWAEYVFIDELLRAPRAVLPVFQTGMASSLFDNGNGMERIPLRTFYGATNSLIEAGDDDLSAFNDRFSAKLIIEPVQAQASAIQIMEGYLDRRRHEWASTPVPGDLVLSREEVDTLTLHSRQMSVPQEVLEAMAQLRSNLLVEGIEPSMRRFNTLLAGMQTDAMLRGQDAVDIEQVQIAKLSLWTDLDEKSQVETAVLQFASEAEKEAAQLADSYDEVRAKFIKLQADYAQVGADNVTSEMTTESLRLLNSQKKIEPKIRKHIDDAARGRDLHKLERILDEMTTTRSWIQENLMGGLDV